MCIRDSNNTSGKLGLFPFNKKCQRHANKSNERGQFTNIKSYQLPGDSSSDTVSYTHLNWPDGFQRKGTRLNPRI